MAEVSLNNEVILMKIIKSAVDGYSVLDGYAVSDFSGQAMSDTDRQSATNKLMYYKMIEFSNLGYSLTPYAVYYLQTMFPDG